MYLWWSLYLVFTCSLNLNFYYKLYKSFVTSTLLYGCETWTLLADSENRIYACETECLRRLLHIVYSEHNDWVQTKINFLWVHRNLFWLLSRDWACHTPWQPVQNHPSGHLGAWMGGAMVGRRNAWWRTSKSGHPFPCQSCSQGSPAEKTGRGSLLNCPSWPPPHPPTPVGVSTGDASLCCCVLCMLSTVNAHHCFYTDALGLILFQIKGEFVRHWTCTDVCKLMLTLNTSLQCFCPAKELPRMFAHQSLSEAYQPRDVFRGQCHWRIFFFYLVIHGFVRLIPPLA